ncbi:hypothetical protein ACFLZJ_01185 [Nanoarchaeota archaeon]
MGNIIKKMLTTTLVSLVLLNPPSLYGQANIEGRIDKEGTALDMKIYGPITEKIGYFARHIQNTDYAGNTGEFTLLDLNYRIYNKSNFVVENQFSRAKINTKTGIGSEAKIGRINLSYAALIDLNKNSQKNELNLYPSYYNENLKLNSEIYINFKDNLKLNFLIGRLNLGWDINDNFYMGIFGQGTLNGNDLKNIEFKPGLFLKIKS